MIPTDRELNRAQRNHVYAAPKPPKPKTVKRAQFQGRRIGDPSGPLNKTLVVVEKGAGDSYVRAVLAQEGNNRSRAAAVLGITYRGLVRRLHVMKTRETT